MKEQTVSGYNKYRSRTWIGAIACFFLIVITLVAVTYLGHIQSPAAGIIPVEAIVFLSFTIIGAFFGKSIIKGAKTPSLDIIGEMVGGIVSEEGVVSDIKPKARSQTRSEPPGSA